MKNEQVHELLYQALETEAGGKQIYSTAVQCATNPDLKEEWEKYLEQTSTHYDTLMQVFEDLGLDPSTQTPGRQIVHHHGESLVKDFKPLSLGTFELPRSSPPNALCWRRRRTTRTGRCSTRSPSTPRAR